MQCNSNLSRAISIADYITEKPYHSVKEASAEFNISKTIVERDINFLGSIAFYGNLENADELKKKYLLVQKVLKAVFIRNCKIVAKERAQSK